MKPQTAPLIVATGSAPLALMAGEPLILALGLSIGLLGYLINRAN